MREIDRIIPASDHQDVAVTGDFIYLHTANLPLKVEVDGQVVTMRQGDKRTVDGGFPHFRVDNENPSDVTAVFIVGSGDYSRQAVTGSVQIKAATNLGTVPDVSLSASSTSQIIAANASRVEVLIANLSGNSETLRLGDANAGATRGIPLLPGFTARITATDDVYAYNPGTSAQSVAVLEVTE